MSIEVRAVVNPRLFGWVLAPVDHEESLKVVAKLYGTTPEKFLAMKPSDRGTMKEETVEKFIAHVKEVAKQDNISVSVCGSKTNPILRMWDRTPGPKKPPRTFEVDLKWSAWSRHEETWAERSGKEMLVDQVDEAGRMLPDREVGLVNGAQVWEAMKAAFEGKGPAVRVKSYPRKEDRFGEVTIEMGKARGVFWSSWDEIDDIADTLGRFDEEGHWIDTDNTREELGISQEEWDEGERSAFIESIPATWHAMGPGQDVDFDIRGRSFKRLMERIDDEEARLVKMDEEEWELLKEMYSRTPSDDGIDDDEGNE